MSGLMDLLTDQLSGDALDSLSSNIGADQDKTRSAVAAALPLLLGALAKNASRPGGAEALHEAIARDHDGSILNDTRSAVTNPNLADGQGILKHVLGGRRGQVEQGLSRASGLGSDQIGKVLATLAPIVLGSLGRAKTTRGMGAQDLTEMLRGERQALEAREPGIESFLTGMLDKDGDGSVLDDLAGGAISRLFGRRN